MPRLRVYARPGCVILLVICVLLAASCSKAGDHNEKVILVSTAASLKDSLEEIIKPYESDHPNIKIQLNFGSSGTLQKQIEQGAPADLFLSAGRQQMDALITKKLVKQSELVLTNRLVVIVPTGNTGLSADVKQLLDPNIRKIAMGQPDTVPAGGYARQSLTSLGLWDKLQPKLVYTQDVRQVLAYVETGNVDAGFAYRTDALGSHKVKIALELPAASHDAIVYPFGLLTGAKYPNEAADFYRYLNSVPARTIFVKYGFQKP
ncbi:MAG: molybdenum transporter substrate-binding protein [Cohnella sp.]|jgi:molybdate transport system substrate-binding protein|nr:molybdenum transporter substrate-binding protein [Cohnella sp.]